MRPGCSFAVGVVDDEVVVGGCVGVMMVVSVLRDAVLKLPAPRRVSHVVDTVLEERALMEAFM